jgi:hypothetical protein
MLQLPISAGDKAAPTPISPLVISDRLISLAEQAGQVGCKATARHLIRLASRVLEERTSLPPIPARSIG